MRKCSDDDEDDDNDSEDFSSGKFSSVYLPLFLCPSFVLFFFFFYSEVYLSKIGFCSVQFSHSVLSDSVTPWTEACQASLSFSNSWSLLRLTSIESVMPFNHLILCCPLLLLPSLFPSIKVNLIPIKIPMSSFSKFKIKILKFV